MSQFRAAISGLAAAILLLAGCSQPVATGRQTAAPEVGGPAAIGPGAVGAGSFPRSFLIPGTDTSIRIGG